MPWSAAVPVLAKVRSFSCAPWKRVRIFEGIIEVFQDAHFSKRVRIFEPSAHLRSRAAALHPVPFSRRVVRALASASIALCGVETNLIDKLAEPECNRPRRIARRGVEDCSPGRVLSSLSHFSPALRNKKSRTLTEGTAPLKRDLQLVAVPYLVVRQLYYCR
jgi:hypothetical protein